MTVATISLPTPQAVIGTFPGVPTSFALPNGDEVHGATVGWTSHDGVYSLVNVVPFTVPPGQEISGPPTYSVSGGVVTETYPTQPIPPATAALTKYQAAIAAGATLTWTTSTTLNATYPIDPITMSNISGVYTYVTNYGGGYPTGNVVRPWPDINGTPHNMSVIQFKLFAQALIKYLDALVLAQQSAAQGGSPTWPPSNISITG